MLSGQIGLTNQEKQPIYQALRECIGDLERILTDSPNTATQLDNSAQKPKNEFNSYRYLISVIQSVYNSKVEEEEKTQAFFDQSKIEALLIKPKNILKVLFNPDFESFSQLNLINNPHYTDKGHEVGVSEFNKKIPAIRNLIIEKLEKIIDQNKKLSPHKSGLTFLNVSNSNKNSISNS